MMVRMARKSKENEEEVSRLGSICDRMEVFDGSLQKLDNFKERCLEGDNMGWFNLNFRDKYDDTNNVKITLLISK